MGQETAQGPCPFPSFSEPPAQARMPREVPDISVQGHSGPPGQSPRESISMGCTVPPPPRPLTWDLLCGLLPRLVGAAPALGQEGRRTTGEGKRVTCCVWVTPLPPRQGPLPPPAQSLFTPHSRQAQWALLTVARWRPDREPRGEQGQARLPHRGAVGVSVHFGSDAGEAP